MAEHFQRIDDLRQGLLQGFARRVDHHLGTERFLVRIADAGEVGDLARNRFLVEAFHIALDEGVERAADEHLDETGRLRSDLVPHLAVGRDRRGDGNATASRNEPGDIADAADVGVAIFFGESQSLGQVGPDIITVEQLDMAAAPRKLLFQGVRDRRLSRTGQACEPDDETLGHASAPKSPQRRLIPLSKMPKRESMTTPMTKITTMIASSCSASEKSRANWICCPSEI